MVDFLRRVTELGQAIRLGFGGEVVAEASLILDLRHLDDGFEGESEMDFDGGRVHSLPLEAIYRFFCAVTLSRTRRSCHRP